MCKTRQLSWRESCVLSSIPLMQVRHKSIVVYPDNIGRKKTSLIKPDFKEKKAYGGRVTAGVRKRMTKAINILLQTAKPQWKQNPAMGYLQYHRISFVTLKITNAENITAREAYNTCFNHFLDWLSRTAGVKLYIWKVELTKAGQIHYHLTVPDMIHYLKLRDKWNSLLRSAGYLNDFVAEHGHYNANSTDIHSVNDIENLSSYMLKALTESIEAAEQIKRTRGGKKTDIAAEMTKDVQNEEETEGKIWGCSEILSAAHYVAFHMSTRHNEVLTAMEREGKIKKFSDEDGFWAVLHFSDCSPPDIMNKHENIYITNYLEWQLARPSKSADEKDFAAWALQKPILNYLN